MTIGSAFLVTALVCIGICAGIYIGWFLFHPDNWGDKK